MILARREIWMFESEFSNEWKGAAGRKKFGRELFRGWYRLLI